MEIGAIRKAVHRKPFEPFHLKMADGTEIEVRHPDFIALPPVGRTVVAFGVDGSISFLESMLIQSIEYSAPQQNGDSASHS